MKILGIEISNFMALKDLNVRLEGKDLIIGGKNGKGKTTLLQAIWSAALGSGQVKEPLTKGETKGHVSIDLGNLIVTKSFTEKGEYLKVTTADGASYGKAQSVLDGLVGKIAIDPHAFMRLSEREQLETMLQIVDIDLDLAAWEKEYKDVFTQRTDINRDLKRLEALRKPIDPSVPETEVNIQDILAKQQEMRRHNEQIAQKQSDLSVLRTKAEAAKERVQRCDEQVVQSDAWYRDEVARIEAEYQNALAGAEKELAHRKQTLAEKRVVVEGELNLLIGEGKSLSAEIADAKPYDLDAINEEIGKAEEVNKSVREKLSAKATDAEYKKASEVAQGLTQKLDEMKVAKAAALKKANLPVEGLGVGEGFLTYRDIPFSQASHAEQMRVAIGLLMAQNPKLQLVTVEDASLMDEDSWSVVKEMSEKHDMQVLYEVVANKPEQMAIYVEDGESSLFLGEQPEFK